MMCLSPQSIQTNQRARICWALRGHVRDTTQRLCDDEFAITLTNTVLLKLFDRISVGSQPKARIMINLLNLPPGNMLNEMFSEEYAHYTSLYLYFCLFSVQVWWYHT